MKNIQGMHTRLEDITMHDYVRNAIADKQSMEQILSGFYTVPHFTQELLKDKCLSELFHATAMDVVHDILQEPLEAA